MHADRLHEHDLNYCILFQSVYLFSLTHDFQTFPSLDKTRLMGAILEGILGGKTKVTAYWMAWIMFSEKGISAKQLRRTFGKDED